MQLIVSLKVITTNEFVYSMPSLSWSKLVKENEPEKYP